jgi:hypothetical protein
VPVLRRSTALAGLAKRVESKSTQICLLLTGVTSDPIEKNQALATR